MTRATTAASAVDGGKRGGWQLDPQAWSSCGLDHRGAGSFDESARRLSHEELAVALRLSEEGHVVRSSPERASARTADLDVCGYPVEVKSWQSRTERSGSRPTPRSVFNKLRQAEGQGPNVVLFANRSGLTRSTAIRGMGLYAEAERLPRLHRVRVIGEGFDLSWSLGHHRHLSRDRYSAGMRGRELSW